MLAGSIEILISFSYANFKWNECMHFTTTFSNATLHIFIHNVIRMFYIENSNAIPLRSLTLPNSGLHCIVQESIRAAARVMTMSLVENVAGWIIALFTLNVSFFFIFENPEILRPFNHHRVSDWKECMPLIEPNKTANKKTNEFCG